MMMWKTDQQFCKTSVDESLGTYHSPCVKDLQNHGTDGSFGGLQASEATLIPSSAASRRRMGNAGNISETLAKNIFGKPWPEFNEGLTYHDLISSSYAGMAVIEYYCKKHKNSAPYQGWLQRIHNKQIQIDGNVVTDPNAILRVGSNLVYHRFPWKEPDAPYQIEILYEDDHLIFLNKPSGLQVLPGGLFQQRTVLTQLQWRATDGTSLSQESNPVPVHRLGRGTSGILLCAKTKFAKSCLSTYFADGTSVVGDKRSTSAEVIGKRKISKVYRALASGLISENEVLINQPIGLVRYPGVANGLYVASPSGKPALSKALILERDVQNSSTLVQVEIQSGRPHQIRIHLSFIGHPLLGDPLYVAGGHANYLDPELVDESLADDGGFQRPVNPVPGDCGYHLHAHRLALVHPISNQLMNVVAPLPLILQASEERQGIVHDLEDGVN